MGGDTGMWDEEDGFFYDVLRLPDGRAQRLKVRSMVGLLPLCAATVFEGELLEKYPGNRRTVPMVPGGSARSWLPPSTTRASRASPAAGSAAILDETKLRRVLAKMLDENEFLSDLRHPLAVALPRRPPVRHPASAARSTASPTCRRSPTRGMFGGNSNWRGPIWMPVNALIIRALLQYYTYYGDDFTVECPTGSGRQMNLYQVAEEICAAGWRTSS